MSAHRSGWVAEIASRRQRIRDPQAGIAKPLVVIPPFPPRAGAATGALCVQSCDSRGGWAPWHGTGNLTDVKVRPRLLVGSLIIAALASLAIGWALAQDRNGSASSDDTELSDDVGIPEPPSIETNAVVKGEELPDVNVQNLDGTDIAIRSLVGQPMVINVWGSTCVPCKKELPDFAAAHLVFGDRVRFVGVSFLGASDREESFARDRGVQYELLYDSEGVFINDTGIAAFPVTLFVNADGIIMRQTGQLDVAQLTEFIENDLL